MTDRLASTADPSNESFSVVRSIVDIAAPPERVFEALTDARELAEWWGGDAGGVRECESDAQPGGAWRVRTVDDTGEERTYGGEYRVVDAPRRLEHTWHGSGDDGVSYVRYDLEPRRVDGVDGTRLTVTHTGPSTTAITAMAFGSTARFAVGIPGVLTLRRRCAGPLLLLSV